MPDPTAPPRLAAPLIVTLCLDAAAQAWFDRRRSEHFPIERLQVGAHVTMFHALPGALEPLVAAKLRELCVACAPFPVAVTRLRFLGRGVAYALDAPPAHRLRAVLAHEFAAGLTPQDRNRWSPHITVQNKAAPEVARKTLAILAAEPAPAGITATGLALWRYRNGPWEAVMANVFAGAGVADG